MQSPCLYSDKNSLSEGSHSPAPRAPRSANLHHPLFGTDSLLNWEYSGTSGWLVTDGRPAASWIPATFHNVILRRLNLWQRREIHSHRRQSDASFRRKRHGRRSREKPPSPPRMSIDKLLESLAVQSNPPNTSQWLLLGKDFQANLHKIGADIHHCPLCKCNGWMQGIFALVKSSHNPQTVYKS
jgi:hypothetical protein